MPIGLRNILGLRHLSRSPAPAAPVSATAALASTDSITLAIDPFDDANPPAHSVWRSVNGGAYAFLETLAPGELLKEYTSLANGTYQYRVYAGRQGVGTTYAQTDAVEVAGELVAPTNLTAENGDNGVDLAWDCDSVLQSGFEVQRKLTSDGSEEWATIDTVDGASRTYHDTGDDLAASTSYDWRVRATLEDEDPSEWSNTATETTVADGGPPEAPTDPSATATSHVAILLEWTPSVTAGATTVIERSLDGETGWAEIAEKAAGVDFHTDTGRTPETQYFYRFAARLVIGGDSSPTTAVSATTTAAPVGSRVLVDSSRFTYRGFYKLNGFSDTGAASRSLAHRRVGGELRFFTKNKGQSVGGSTSGNKVFEFTLTGSPGMTMATAGGKTVLRSWNHHELWAWSPEEIAAGTGYTGSGAHGHIWWDEENQRLCYSTAPDYPSDATSSSTTVLTTRTLNDDGTCSDYHGFFGVQGWGNRQHFGGIRRVPQWFRDTYSVPKYISGWGSYTSRVSQGLGPRLGLSMLFMPEPVGYPELANGDNNYSIPAADVVEVCRASNANLDWTSVGYENKTYDRGVRISLDYENYYNVAGNSSSYFNETVGAIQPVESGRWGVAIAEDDPDGWGRWMWGDTYSGCCEWLDNDDGDLPYHGLVLCGTFTKGGGWYEDSQLNGEYAGVELHFYDPDDIAAKIAAGTPNIPVRPRSMWDISDIIFASDALYPGGSRGYASLSTEDGFPIVGNGVGSGGGTCGISGMTFDWVDRKLYLLHQVAGGNSTNNPGLISKLHVFDVDLGD